MYVETVIFHLLIMCGIFQLSPPEIFIQARGHRDKRIHGEEQGATVRRHGIAGNHGFVTSS